MLYINGNIGVIEEVTDVATPLQYALDTAHEEYVERNRALLARMYRKEITDAEYRVKMAISERDYRGARKAAWATHARSSR